MRPNGSEGVDVAPPGGSENVKANLYTSGPPLQSDFSPFAVRPTAAYGVDRAVEARGPVPRIFH